MNYFNREPYDSYYTERDNSVEESTMNLCYTINPGTETAYEKKKREYAARIALANREYEESLGLCRCWSEEHEEFLRNIYEDGCPNHRPRKL